MTGGAQPTTGGMPAIGFGTWERRGAEGEAAVAYALELGYRHIDTAQSYENEEQCGAALAKSGLARDAVFVTTKVRPENYGAGTLRPSVEESLEKLGVDQVDLLLLHWPSRHDAVPMPVYVEQLANVHDAGLTRAIGVSNFTIALIEKARAMLGGRRIAADQVEIHVHGQNRALTAHCRALDIPTVAYCPLARGRLADDPVLGAIAADHDATWAQIALAFLLAEGHVVIPTSGNHERIAANLAAADITLADNEIRRIRARDRGHHIVDNREWMPVWD